VGDGGEGILDKCAADVVGGFPPVSAPDPATTWDQACRRRAMLGDASVDGHSVRECIDMAEVRDT
jgi:hypothetical protein